MSTEVTEVNQMAEGGEVTVIYSQEYTTDVEPDEFEKALPVKPQSEAKFGEDCYTREGNSFTLYKHM